MITDFSFLCKLSLQNFIVTLNILVNIFDMKRPLAWSKKLWSFFSQPSSHRTFYKCNYVLALHHSVQDLLSLHSYQLVSIIFLLDERNYFKCQQNTFSESHNVMVSENSDPAVRGVRKPGEDRENSWLWCEQRTVSGFLLPGASGRVNYVTDLPHHSGTVGCG